MRTRHLTKTLGHYEIQGARAVDGDTIEAVVLLPFGSMVNLRIRLAGWWAPELEGPDRPAAEAARDCLQKFLKENVCTIFSRSERKDRYGRAIASLWASGKPVDPKAVLGLWYVTEAQHKAENDWIRKHRKAGFNLQSDEPGSYDDCRPV